MYHEVVEPGDTDRLARKIQRGYLTPRNEFSAHLEMLAAEGFQTVGLERLCSPEDTGAWPERPLVITFDDGFAGNHRHALPLLRASGFTATFFVVTERIGQEDMLTWQELDAMAGAGMAIESHTAHHPLLSALDEAQTRAELCESRKCIEDHLGRKVRFLSLPNGDRNAHVVRIAEECGYWGICGSRLGWNRPGADRWDLERIAMRAGVDPQRLRRLLLGRGPGVAVHRAKAQAKRLAAAVLGKARYDRIYNRVFGVRASGAGEGR